MKNILLVLFIFCLCACNSSSNKNKENNESKKEIAGSYNSTNSISYYGTYSGIIPSASGQGIKLKLVLKEDKSFTLVSDYIGEKDGIYTEQGDYTIDKDIITLENKNEPPKYFKIQENRVIMLDSEKQEVTGNLAKMYILDKIPNEEPEAESIMQEVKPDKKNVKK